MIEKIRPNTSIEWSDGNGLTGGHHYIEYRCPKFNRIIRWYKSDTACDKCGTFYDWGSRQPRIEITLAVKW